MTKPELVDCLHLMALNFNKNMDDDLIALWIGLFGKFDARLFQKACIKIITSNSYFPNAKEMIDAYQEIKQTERKERYEQLKAKQRLLVAKQEYCYLCDDTGWCRYTKDDRELTARCVCAHGTDLDKFKLASIQKDYVVEPKDYQSMREKEMIKQGKNPYYVRTIQEVLGDDFEAYKAKRKHEYQENSQKSPSEMLSKLPPGCQEALKQLLTHLKFD